MSAPPRTRALSGWGRAQRRVSPVLSPTADEDLSAQVAACGDLLTARGAGCSYGDAALPAEAPTTVLDTTATRMNIADFGYAPELKLVVIPTFTGGRIAAYRLGR